MLRVKRGRVEKTESIVRFPAKLGLDRSSAAPAHAQAQRERLMVGERARRNSNNPTAWTRLAATRAAKVEPMQVKTRHAGPERVARGGVRVIVQRIEE